MRTARRWSVQGSLLTAGTVVLGVCWLGMSAPVSATTTTVKLQLKWSHQFQFAGYYVAKEKGYYAKAGLDVEFLEREVTIDPSEAVLNKKAEFGIAGSELVVMRGRKKPVVALASIYQHSGVVLMAKRQSGINNIHDIVGKNVALNPFNAEILQYLRLEGISLNQIQTVTPLDPLQDLIHDKVDVMVGYVSTQPYELQEQGIFTNIFNPRSSGVDFYGDTIYCLEDYARKNPATVDAFVRASLRGWDTAFKNTSDTINLIYNKYSQKKSIRLLSQEAQRSRLLVKPEAVDLGYINKHRWERMAQIYAELGIIPDEYSLDTFFYYDDPAYTQQPPVENKRDIGQWLWLLTTPIIFGLVALVLAVYFRSVKLRRELDIQSSDHDIKHSLTLLAQAPFAVMITSPETGQILFANKRCAELFDVVPELLVGKDIRSFYFDPGSRQELAASLLQKGFLQDVDVPLLRVTGEKFWASCSAALVKLEDKPAFFLTLTDFNNIYDIKQELVRNQHRFQIMSDAVPALMASIDYRYNFEFANQTCREWLGLSLDKNEPITITARKVLNGHLLELLEKTLLQFEGLQPLKSSGYEMMADGKRRYIDMTVIPRQAEEGHIEGWFVLATDVTAWREMEVQLKEQALTDELTGLHNRRYFNQTGPTEITRALRYNRSLSLLVLDIDHFKTVNDTYGHDVGDMVLKNLAAMLRQRFRMMDSVIRIGGEEFVVMMPETSVESAMEIAEQCRRDVEMSSVLVGGDLIRFTISIGVAGFDTPMTSLLDLLRAADQALYQAKFSGRNRVILYSAESTMDIPAKNRVMTLEED